MGMLGLGGASVVAQGRQVGFHGRGHKPLGSQVGVHHVCIFH